MVFLQFRAALDLLRNSLFGKNIFQCGRSNFQSLGRTFFEIIFRWLSDFPGADLTLRAPHPTGASPYGRLTLRAEFSFY